MVWTQGWGKTQLQYALIAKKCHKSTPNLAINLYFPKTCVYVWKPGLRALSGDKISKSGVRTSTLLWTKRHENGEKEFSSTMFNSYLQLSLLALNKIVGDSSCPSSTTYNCIKSSFYFCTEKENLYNTFEEHCGIFAKENYVILITILTVNLVAK